MLFSILCCGLSVLANAEHVQRELGETKFLQIDSKNSHQLRVDDHASGRESVYALNNVGRVLQHPGTTEFSQRELENMGQQVDGHDIEKSKPKNIHNVRYDRANSVSPTSTVLLQAADPSMMESATSSENQLLLQKLYYVLGAGAVLALLTLCGELFSSWPMCSCLQNLWVIALMAAGHQTTQSSVIHFGQQLFAIGFGPLFLFRGIMTFSVSLCLAKCGNSSVTLWPEGRRVRVLLVSSGFIASLSILFLTAALMYAPSPVVNVLYSSRSFFGALGGLLFLGEMLKWQQWVCMALGLGVVVLLIYSSASGEVMERKVGRGDLDLPLGAGFCLLAALFQALSMVTMRCLKGQTDHLALAVAGGWTNILLCIPIAMFFFSDFARVVVSPSVHVLIVLLGQGTASVLAQMMTNKMALMAKLGPIQTFLVGSGLVLQVFVDLFMGYRYQLMMWVALGLMLLWLPCSAAVDMYLAKHEESSSKDVEADDRKQ